MAYESSYDRAQRAIAQRKRTEEIKRRQKEQSRELGEQWLRATGRGGGIPGRSGYIAPQFMTPQQSAQNLAALRAARNAPMLQVSPEERTRRGITDLRAYYQQQAMGRTAALSRSFGQQPTPPTPQPTYQPRYQTRPIPQQPQPIGTPDVRLTPQPSPQQIELMKFTTPTAPIPQPTPTPQISFSPTTPQAQPTYQPTPTQTYQSTYYQANGYKPYGGYQQDTFGDKPFSYAYKQPRLQQSYTGI